MICAILAKSPVPGRVKTRLCPPATPEQAARLAAAAFLDTLATVTSCSWIVPVVALAGKLDHPQLRAAMRDVPVVVQRGENLGERIAAAHLDAAALFPGRPILQIGMDTPQLTAADLEQCRDAMHDGVLAPAADGGWWLLGLRNPEHARLVADVPMSRPDTGARTLAALRNGGLRVALGPELSDVDTMADAYAVAALAPRSRFAAELG
ncbi:TIGR04282 family arsenosugar biosynthesis glycosyltransferase [Fodinicola acaciae]|uniref:TIGR04282 family arsenosugar biosynthesis glycosyltransferase n=1 Tax=Fodinicola acaciae TaxID=2681555 RepID=UPI0013CF9B9D|nr:DUF2064 domain-containing protein [Fodinicola acaciae]